LAQEAAPRRRRSRSVQAERAGLLGVAAHGVRGRPEGKRDDGGQAGGSADEAGNQEDRIYEGGRSADMVDPCFEGRGLNGPGASPLRRGVVRLG
jgi:hypothetical protein